MSRRNRNKFRVRDTSPAVSSPVSGGSGAVMTSSFGGKAASGSATATHAAEYKIISKDLARLVVLNVVMFAAVMVLYFTNRSSGYLEHAFSNLLK